MKFQSPIKPLNDDLSNTERKELIILKTKKVPLFDKQVIRQFGSRSATLFAILSAVLIFVDIPVNLRLIAGGVVLLVLVAIYFLTWHRANTLNDISISIGATTVQIKSGDLFKQDRLKAIAFNEYFDTQVDDVIIAKRSLNGKKSKDTLCPKSLDDKLSIFIPFGSKIMQYALEKWPTSDASYRKDGKTGAYHYKQSVYDELGI